MKGFFKDIFELRLFLSSKDEQKIIVLFLLMVVAACLEALGIAAVPVFISMVIDPSSLADNQWVGDWATDLPEVVTLEILIWASCYFIGFIVFKNLFLSLVFYVQSKIIVTQRIKLSDRMYRVYQNAPYEWLIRRSSSEMIRNIENDTFQVTNAIFLPFMDLILAFIMTVIIVATLFLNTPPVILFGLLITGIGLFIIIRLFQERLKRSGVIIRNENNILIKSIQQGFGALVDSRIIGCEEFLNQGHKDSLERQGTALRNQTVIQKSTPYAVETFAILGLLSSLLWLFSISKMEDILPVVALISIATLRLKQSASSLATSINRINGARPYISGIVSDLKELEAVGIQEKQCETGQIFEKFETLSLEKVCYTYPGTDSPALRDITLKLQAGESIAFVGTTGCGKTTLINLLLGLIKPKDGSILMNGSNIQQCLKTWRHTLGYIPQSVYLIDDTLKANIAFGVQHEDIDDDSLCSAIRTASLESFIHSLPEGLDTVVGERGVRLSGGQRQRLGIARCLYFNPDVLVMDEATSALDNKTEVEVMHAINNIKQNRTLIMIAHRLSTVENCDRLYFLQNGMICEEGTYDEIKNNSKAFREMANLELK